MNTLIVSFGEKFNREIVDTDFSSLYEDIDLLGIIPEYDVICKDLENDNLSKEDKKALQKEFNKIERAILMKNKLIKLKGEDKNYYCLKDSAYDNVGMLIDCDYGEYLDDDNLFCEYNGDSIYDYMQTILYKKIKKYSEYEENY